MLHGFAVIVKRNGLDGSRYPVTEREVKIGTSAECRIRINTPYVAKVHCALIVRDNGLVYLKCLAQERTALNDEHVGAGESLLLNHGDVMEIGGRLIRWEYLPNSRVSNGNVGKSASPSKEISIRSSKTKSPMPGKRHSVRADTPRGLQKSAVGLGAISNPRFNSVSKLLSNRKSLQATKLLFSPIDKNRRKSDAIRNLNEDDLLQMATIASSSPLKRVSLNNIASPMGRQKALKRISTGGRPLSSCLRRSGLLTISEVPNSPSCGRLAASPHKSPMTKTPSPSLRANQSSKLVSDYETPPEVKTPAGSPRTLKPRTGINVTPKSPQLHAASVSFETPPEVVTPQDSPAINRTVTPAKIKRPAVKGAKSTPRKKQSRRPVFTNASFTAESDFMMTPPQKSTIKSPTKATPAKVSRKSPVKSAIKSHSPVKALLKSKSPTNSPKATRKSPIAAKPPSLKTSLKSPVKSPAKSSSPAKASRKSPKMTLSKSPLKSPQKSPVKTPAKSSRKSPKTTPSKSPYLKASRKSPAKSPAKSDSPVKAPKKSTTTSPAKVPSPKSSKKSPIPTKTPPQKDSQKSPRSLVKTLSPNLMQRSFIKTPAKSVSPRKSAANSVVKSPSPSKISQKVIAETPNASMHLIEFSPYVPVSHIKIKSPTRSPKKSATILQELSAPLLLLEQPQLNSSSTTKNAIVSTPPSTSSSRSTKVNAKQINVISPENAALKKQIRARAVKIFSRTRKLTSLPDKSKAKALVILGKAVNSKVAADTKIKQKLVKKAIKITNKPQSKRVRAVDIVSSATSSSSSTVVRSSSNVMELPVPESSYCVGISGGRRSSKRISSKNEGPRPDFTELSPKALGLTPRLISPFIGPNEQANLGPNEKSLESLYMVSSTLAPTPSKQPRKSVAFSPCTKGNESSAAMDYNTPDISQDVFVSPLTSPIAASSTPFAFNRKRGTATSTQSNLTFYTPEQSSSRSSKKHGPLLVMDESAIRDFLGTPKGTEQLSPESPDDLLRSTVIEVGKSRKGVISNDEPLIGVKALMKTPRSPLKVHLQGVSRLYRTPRPSKNAHSETLIVSGVKRLLSKTPKNDLRFVPPLNKMFKTPQPKKSVKPKREKAGPVMKSPKNDLTDVRGVKKLFATRVQQKSPRNDLSNVLGVKELFIAKSPKNNLLDVSGIKKVLGASPKNDLRDIPSIRRLMRTPISKKRSNKMTPKQGKSPLNDITDVTGVKKLFSSPTRKSPRNDLSDVDGLGTLFASPESPSSPAATASRTRGRATPARSTRARKVTAPTEDSRDEAIENIPPLSRKRSAARRTETPVKSNIRRKAVTPEGADSLPLSKTRRPLTTSDDGSNKISATAQKKVTRRAKAVESPSPQEATDANQKRRGGRKAAAAATAAILTPKNKKARVAVNVSETPSPDAKEKQHSPSPKKRTRGAAAKISQPAQKSSDVAAKSSLTSPVSSPKATRAARGLKVVKKAASPVKVSPKRTRTKAAIESPAVTSRTKTTPAKPMKSSPKRTRAKVAVVSPVKSSPKRTRAKAAPTSPTKPSPKRTRTRAAKSAK